jgi:hypothetical protein
VAGRGDFPTRHPWLGRKTTHILCVALRVCRFLLRSVVVEQPNPNNININVNITINVNGNINVNGCKLDGTFGPFELEQLSLRRRLAWCHELA